MVVPGASAASVLMTGGSQGRDGIRLGVGSSPWGPYGWTRNRENLEGREPGRNSLGAVLGRVGRKYGGRTTGQSVQKLNGETEHGEAESRETRWVGEGIPWWRRG